MRSSALPSQKSSQWKRGDLAHMSLKKGGGGEAISRKTVSKKQSSRNKDARGENCRILEGSRTLEGEKNTRFN